MTEEWKIIPRFMTYEASNQGRIRSTINKRFKPPRLGHTILKSQREIDGRHRVSIRIDGRCRRYLVHKLVMEAFVGECPQGYEVNHINGDHTDNRLANLEYVTKRRNYDHAIEKGLHRRNECHHMAKLSKQDVLDIRKRAIGAPRGTDRMLAREYGVSGTLITNIKNGRVRKYVEEIR